VVIYIYIFNGFNTQTWVNFYKHGDSDMDQRAGLSGQIPPRIGTQWSIAMLIQVIR
jgi:hypothetical protein